MLDIEAEATSFPSLAAIAAMQLKKTGALFRFACESGAILAGADPTPLRQYANHIGLVFQITDDILDVTGTPKQMGKATQKDQGKSKATFVDVLGIDGAKQEAARFTERAIAALTDYGPRADMLRETARFILARKK